MLPSIQAASRQMRTAQPQVDSLFRVPSCGPELQLNLFVYAEDEFFVSDLPQAGPTSRSGACPGFDVTGCVARQRLKFDISTTVNLDSEVSKLQEHVENGLSVPTVGAHLPSARHRGQECHGDESCQAHLAPLSRGGGRRRGRSGQIDPALVTDRFGVQGDTGKSANL